MNREERIYRDLSQGLNIQSLHIENESHLHAGHQAATTESHFFLRITAQEFKGQTRRTRHRLVHQLLSAEFKSGLHALRLDLQSPSD